MKTYFNLRNNGAVDTIDEINSKDFSSYVEFINERKRLLKEYRMCMGNVYTSQRATKDWSIKQ